MNILTAGNSDLPPLFLECLSSKSSPEDVDHRYRAIEQLLMTGADPNYATSSLRWVVHPFKPNSVQQMLPQSTPLWAAAHATRDVKLLTLLLAYGAAPEPLPLFHNLASESSLKTAREHLASYKRDLSSTIVSATDILPPASQHHC